MDLSSGDDFGQRLRRWRRSAEIKQTHLAELLGVSQGTVSRWEQGVQTPAPMQRALLASVLAGGNRRLDAALKRLIRDSRRRVHLIEDRSHRLLCASVPREREWRRNQDELLGTSLWRFATPDIARAERKLREIGWHDGRVDQYAFAIAGREGEPLRIVDRYVLWERFRLADGTVVRLTTGYDRPPVQP